MKKEHRYLVEKQKNLPIKRNKVKLIKKLVNEYFGLNSDNGRRHKDVILARQIAMYLINENIKISLREIGLLFKGQNKEFLDHSTVLHHSNKIKGFLEIRDKEITSHIDNLKDKAKEIANISDKDIELHYIKTAISEKLENKSKDYLEELLLSIVN